jgi:ADP-ribosylglycohydrolase
VTTSKPPQQNPHRMASKQLVQTRVRRALTLAFAADALAMPAHWFYDTAGIDKDFGAAGVTGYAAPPLKHPYTFMKVPEADPAAGGKKVVGEVILRQTAANWGPENQHVHVGLPAGANTLNAEVAAHVVLPQLAGGKPFNADAFIADYMAFMTADPQLPKDTYAEGWHRAFFAGIAGGKAPKDCADTSEGAESVGGFVAVLPVVLVELLRDGDVARVTRLAQDVVSRTHDRDRSREVIAGIVALAHTLLFRESDAVVVDAIRAALDATNATLPKPLDELIRAESDRAVINASGEVIGSFCDLKASWPAVAYLSAKYAGRAQEGILANVNVGGENCHRGFVVGAILGLTGDEGAAAAVAAFGPGLADKSVEARINDATAI